MSQGTLPVLPVADVVAAITHYVEVLGFSEDFRVPMEDGPVVTGQVRRGNCQIMFNLNPKDADKRGGGVWLWVRVDEEDIDALYASFVENNIPIQEELGNRFWGDRSFAFQDANGYTLAFNKRLSAPQ